MEQNAIGSTNLTSWNFFGSLRPNFSSKIIQSKNSFVRAWRWMRVTYVRGLASPSLKKKHGNCMIVRFSNQINTMSKAFRMMWRVPLTIWNNRKYDVEIQTVHNYEKTGETLNVGCEYFFHYRVIRSIFICMHLRHKRCDSVYGIFRSHWKTYAYCSLKRRNSIYVYSYLKVFLLRRYYAVPTSHWLTEAMRNVVYLSLIHISEPTRPY